MQFRNFTHLFNEVRITKVECHLKVLIGRWVLRYLEGSVFSWNSPYALTPTLRYSTPSLRYRIFTGQLLITMSWSRDRRARDHAIHYSYFIGVILYGAVQDPYFVAHQNLRGCHMLPLNCVSFLGLYQIFSPSCKRAQLLDGQAGEIKISIYGSCVVIYLLA